MKNLLKILVFSLMVWGVLHSNPARADDQLEAISLGQTYYTRVNIWYESADKLSTTNYHDGTILPKGTKVKITNIDAKKATFLVQPEDVEFTLNYDAKNTAHSFDKILGQLFSSKNEWMFKFSGTEQQAIKDGRVVPGIRREAVLAAYGYPPSKITPLLQSTNEWTYFTTRRHRMVVHFDGDKVIRIEQ